MKLFQISHVPGPLSNLIEAWKAWLFKKLMPPAHQKIYDWRGRCKLCKRERSDD